MTWMGTACSCLSAGAEATAQALTAPEGRIQALSACLPPQDPPRPRLDPPRWLHRRFAVQPLEPGSGRMRSASFQSARPAEDPYPFLRRPS